MNEPKQSQVYQGKLSNGIKYSVHEAKSFSDYCEIALFIEDEFITVVTVIPTRNGNIEIVPTSPGKKLIRSERFEKEEKIELLKKPGQAEENENKDKSDLLSGVKPG